MSLMNRMMSYDKTKLNQECNCDEYVSTDIAKSENQIVEYPKLSEEEIEQIIFERYSDKDDKTKKFIRKALKVHGDKYDYSNVVYVKSTLKLEIICRVKNHSSFWQTADSHLHNHGCSKCAYEYNSECRKLTNDSFIEKANKIHGVGKYDYSKVNYINSHTKVIIICKFHGNFSQTPNDHLNGYGCPCCGGTKKLMLNEFIEKANNVHGNGRYDYSKTKYINANTKILILCHNHDKPYNFYQLPSAHLQGQGCPKCAIEKNAKENRLTLEEFIERANKKHGIGRYDYSKINYVNNSTNVTIVCHNHNEPYEFEQTPNNHLRGKGCPICKGGVKSNTEEFIKKANEVHKGIYDYSKVNYINNHTEVIIICPKHGEFLQTPQVHLFGCGCPKCNKNKGEESVRKFLTEKWIEFEEQKTFDGCKYKQLLKFDFYLPQYNLCIESDGIPHFEKVNWNGKMTEEQMEENLKLNQLRDKIKNDYCKNNGINLLRIRYDENIEEKLIKYFQNYKK